MSDDLIAALFTGRELRGCGPGGFVHESRPDVVAGHGLGDLAALVAAGALDHGDALRLAVVREQLIARANERVGGGMLAVLGAHAAAFAARIAERSGVQVARHDSPARVVVAGSHEQLRQARAVAAELHVAVAEVAAPAALHCSALSADADAFASMLESVPFRRPALAVYSSVTAEPIRDPRSELARCLEAPVLWSDTARALDAAGAARFVEAGRGRVLGDLVCETLLGPQDAGTEPEPAHA
jgi:[acyl-carrier-protein] S-malonyltransferase